VQAGSSKSREAEKREKNTETVVAIFFHVLAFYLPSNAHADGLWMADYALENDHTYLVG
jgi:hypothetical protein